jgi:histidine decarboxylase
MHTVIQDSMSRLDQFYLGEDAAIQQLNDFSQRISEKRKYFMGYPCNAAFRLDQFFKWWANSSLSRSPLNEVGNPNSETSYSLNARPFETTVLQFFADLYAIKPFWGYVTAGGTQGNEQGLSMGRHVLETCGCPLLYFSEEAHYSIASLGRLLGLDSCIIHSKANGEMDYDDLRQKLDPTRPALFSLSIGTTFKGAIDRIEIIQSIVHDKRIQRVFYHADAALFGGYLPFYPDVNKPDLNFEKYPYDSIAVSGHKFFGSPIPLGIFLIREKYIHPEETDYIEYIHSHNITIPCSRSALNTLILWWTATTTPREELTKEAIQIIESARHFYREFQKRRYPAWLNPYSNTVFFKSPSSQFCQHWSLSLMTCPKLGPLAHAIMMQHVDKKMMDEFFYELDQELKDKT